MTHPAVPFLDLGPSHLPLRGALIAGLEELLDSGAFINGPHVERFEAEFAAYCGAPLCVGLSSGLDALRLALQAAGIGPGDEVVAPAHTFIATIEAISQTGATPVLADVGGDDGNLDPAAAEAAVTPRTRALLAVHLYGQMADVERLGAVSRQHALDLLEDAAQAHGAERGGVRAGQAGRAAAFSFYPGKNLGALGDAGALVTADEQLAGSVRALREHGQRRKHEHEAIGWTARLDTIQALALSLKLPLLDGCNDERRTIAARYDDALAGVGDLVLPAPEAGSRPVWHVYAVRTADPEAIAAHLRARGVSTGRHYPRPVHLTEAYRHLGHVSGAFPEAEAWAREQLSLPVFPGMTDAQAEAVVDALRDYFAAA